VLSAAKVGGLLNASGAVTLQSDGKFTYQNTDPSIATDLFLYEACDEEGACKAGVVSITISNDPMDLPPIATDDAIEVAPNGSTSTIVGDPNTVDSVLDNDSDPDAGDALVAHLINPPTNGDITLNTNGTFTYVNTNSNAATDELQYETCDSQGACVAATVSVVMNQNAPTVTCVLPRQVDVVGDTVNLDLSLLFTAPAGQSLTYSADNLPMSLSIVGSLLSGILQASDVPGSPYASTLRATTVPGNVSATENVIVQVLPTGEIIFRNSFDDGTASQPCQ
jgi:VCBS repeat-containing protein